MKRLIKRKRGIFPLSWEGGADWDGAFFLMRGLRPGGMGEAVENEIHPAKETLIRGTGRVEFEVGDARCGRAIARGLEI